MGIATFTTVASRMSDAYLSGAMIFISGRPFFVSCASAIWRTSAGVDATSPGGTGMRGADGVGDDQWYAMWLSVESGTSVYRVVRMLDDTVVASGVLGFAAVDPRDTTDIWLGGRASVTSKGKQDRCVTASYGAVVIGDTGANYIGTGPYAGQVRVLDHTQRWLVCASYSGNTVAVHAVNEQGQASASPACPLPTRTLRRARCRSPCP